MVLNLISEGINGLRRFRFRGFSWEEKFGQKYFIAHSKLSKSAKSIENVSSGPAVFAYLSQLANKVSQIRSILGTLMRLFLSLLFCSLKVGLEKKVNIVTIGVGSQVRKNKINSALN